MSPLCIVFIVFGTLVYLSKYTMFKNFKTNWVSWVEGVDLSQPMSQETVQDLFMMLCYKKVIVFKNQKLNNQQLISIGEIYGRVWDETDIDCNFTEFNLQKRSLKEDGKITLLDRDQFLLNTGLQWHHDLGFQAIETLPGRILYAVELDKEKPITPTFWINSALTVDRLTPKEKEILFNSYYLIRNSNGTYIRRPCINKHPVTNELLFNLDETAHKILGFDGNTADFVYDIIMRMHEYEEVIYRHDWEENDLVIYDNTGTLHARQYTNLEKRRLHRVTFDINWFKYNDY